MKEAYGERSVEHVRPITHLPFGNFASPPFRQQGLNTLRRDANRFHGTNLV
jgi:hypothetical protein